MPAKKGAGQPAVEITTKGETATLSLHKDLYPTDALFGTAFTFLDRCFIHLDVDGADRITVQLTARPGSPVALKEVAGEFENELVNQVLRFKLAKATEKVRTTLVGRAIGLAIPEEETAAPAAPAVPDLPPEVAKLLAEEEDSLDFLDDPLGIAVPWEEKYGKKDGKAPEATPDAGIPPTK